MVEKQPILDRYRVDMSLSHFVRLIARGKRGRGNDIAEFFCPHAAVHAVTPDFLSRFFFGSVLLSFYFPNERVCGAWNEMTTNSSSGSGPYTRKHSIGS